MHSHMMFQTRTILKRRAGGVERDREIERKDVWRAFKQE